jgi:tetratricopeptide (TPR) repeat protein
LLQATAAAAGRQLDLRSKHLRDFVAAEHAITVRSVEAAHRQLHDRVLRGPYREGCYDVVATLEDGEYNCLTATILLKAYCDVEGIPLQVVATNRHVATMLPDGTVIEPACREWYAPNRTAASRLSFLASVFADDSAQNPQLVSTREIAAPVLSKLDAWQLIARVHFNRGIAATSRSAFPEAVEQFAIAVKLDPRFTESRQNEFATRNNWAIALSRAGEFTAAQEQLAHARSLDALSPLLHANQQHVDHRQALEFCQQRRYREALTVLEAGQRRSPDASLYARAAMAVGREWIRSSRQSGKPADASRLLHEFFDAFPELADCDREVGR